MLFIAIPGVLLAGLGLFQIFRSNQPEKVIEKKVVEDQNVKIQNLEKQVGKLFTAFNEFGELSRKEDPKAKAKGEALAAQIDAWFAEWEEIFGPKRDAEGRLPKEYKSYQDTRSRLNTLRSDLSRSMGFE